MSEPGCRRGAGVNKPERAKFYARGEDLYVHILRLYSRPEVKNHVNSPTNEASADARNEEQYRLVMGSRYAFHSSLG